MTQVHGGIEKAYDLFARVDTADGVVVLAQIGGDVECFEMQHGLLQVLSGIFDVLPTEEL